MYPLLAILSLGFLIVVHEGGHYFVARWCGMRIERFSIGFGPGIFKRRSKKTGTLFQIAPIPFGGFVEIRGMNIAEDVDPEDVYAYPNRPAWQRFITIFAGPGTNYISAVVLAFALYSCHGIESAWRWFAVAAVQSDYDAAGKLEVGDRIIAVDHVPILADGDYTPPDGGPTIHGGSLVQRVNDKHGQPLTLTIVRDHAQHDVTIQPKIGGVKFGDTLVPALRPGPGGDCISETAMAWMHVDPEQVPMRLRCDESSHTFFLLGITPYEQPDYIHVGLVSSAGYALSYPIFKTKQIAAGLYGIIRATPRRRDPGGSRTRILSDEFEKAQKRRRFATKSASSSYEALLVYLGLFNLFPLPALDGGRLVFLGYEMVTRRRANPKIEAMIHMGGIMVLGVVMVLVTLRDFGVF